MVQQGFIEMVILFVLGVAGSIVQLFIILIITGELRILINKIVHSQLIMAIFFTLVGGFITLIYSLSVGQSPFDFDNFWKIFVVGISWQGLILSYAVVKKADDGEDLPYREDQLRRLQERVDDLTRQNYELMRQQIA